MFVQRAIVSATMGSLAVWLLYQGGYWFAIPVLVLLLIGGVEFVNIAKEMQITVQRELLLATIGLQVVATVFLGSNGLSAALIVSLFWALCIALWRYEKAEVGLTSAEWFATTTGIVFLGWMGSHFVLMRNLLPETGSLAWQWTTLVIMTTWSANKARNVAAYQIRALLADTI